MPRVSVIVPCYKAGRYLPATVDSVLRQTFSSWELILVDDGSPDDTLETARVQAKRDPRIRFFTQPNQGQSAARNLGACEASPGSEFFYFLDADDLLHPEALARLVTFLDSHPEAGVVTSEKADIDSEGNPLPPNPVRRWASGFLGWPQKLHPTVSTTPFATYYSGCAGGIWALYRSRLFLQIGGWNEALRAFEDCDLLGRFALASQAGHVPEVLNYYRKHSSQMTGKGDFINSNYVAFRAFWDSCRPTNSREAQLLNNARRFHLLWHEPGRHFRICLKTAPALIKGPRGQAWWWFRTNLADGAKAWIRGLRQYLKSHS